MPTKYNNIYVALDFSEKSTIAFEKAKQIAKNNEGTLNLICVIDTHSFGTVEAYDRKYAKQLAEKAQAELEKLKQQAIEGGVKIVNTIVKEGAAKKILTNLDDADLIIVGATGRGALEIAMLGSVSTNIVRSAKCDVLVVR